MSKEDKKILNWNGKKLSQFLIWDYIENLSKADYWNPQNVINDNFRTAVQKYKKYKIILGPIDNIYNIISPLKLTKKRGNSDRKILFSLGIQFPLIVLAAKKSHLTEMIVMGRKDCLFAIKNFIKYKSYTDLNQFVYNYLTKKNEQYLCELMDNIEERIKRTNPDYIVLWNDSLPIERAIVLLSRKLKIPTIVIQHGAYSLTSPPSDGKVADYVLVWGQYFKDLYIKKGGKKPENVYVLGYPYSIEESVVSNKKDKRYAVYFLGQDCEKYDKKLLDVKIKTVTGINNICRELGMRFVYRPHIGDDVEMLRSKLSEIDFSPKNEKLTEVFNKGDIFISFSSTSLVEAAMRLKICLQLRNYPLISDNFEELGICNKSFDKIEQLAEHLKILSKLSNSGQEKPNFNNSYIETRYNPGKRFLEIIDNIRTSRFVREP